MCTDAPNAVDVTALGESSRGPLSTEQVVETDGAGRERLAFSRVLTIPAADLPSFTAPGALTVDGVAMRAREVRILETGVLKQLVLVQ